MKSFNSSEFNELGYTLIEGVMSISELIETRKIIEALANHEHALGASDNYTVNGLHQRVWNLLNKHRIFHSLISKDVIVNAMEIIFDRNTVHQKYFLSSFQANILKPGADALKLHIDTPVPEPLPPWIIKANTVWLLDDFTSENGATKVVPRSHKLDYKPRLDDPILSNIHSILAPAGSVLITHGALWHQSDANRSVRNRSVLLGSFAASYAREIANEENICAMLDERTFDCMSTTLKRIIGINHGEKMGSHIKPPWVI
jgi:ectoine hydroxylase-related dioxygenase (phytanoyl-CoA dioxygenase family)